MSTLPWYKRLWQALVRRFLPSRLPPEPPRTLRPVGMGIAYLAPGESGYLEGLSPKTGRIRTPVITGVGITVTQLCVGGVPLYLGEGCPSSLVAGQKLSVLAGRPIREGQLVALWVTNTGKRPQHCAAGFLLEEDPE